MSDRSAQSYEYIIVGGGAMGVSTASHLSHQSESVLVLDHKFSCAASRDVNKIVRFDYTDPFYMNLAREARSEWTSSSLFKGLFHPTGRVVAYDGESQLSSIKANHKLHGLSILEDMTPADAAQKLGGLISCPSPNATFNPLDAWVNFPQCVAAMEDEAITRGVQFKNDLVEELNFDSSGRCTGVSTTDGVIFCSKKVIVAAGAWTEKLLATHESLSGHFNNGIKPVRGPHLSRLPIIPALSSFIRHTPGCYDTANANLSSYPVATGVCVVHFTLYGEERERFKRNPIFSYLGHGKFLSL
jgi:glycine/D-amino acid oxidase-like deaminating enzyme